MLELSNTTAGVKRFISYAVKEGYYPRPVETTQENKDKQPVTLVFATDQIYFLVRPQYPQQRIPRRIVRELIRTEDLKAAFEEGLESVQGEMSSGYMSPFVSEDLTNFTVYLDKSTFRGNRRLIFKLQKNGNSGFMLPAYAFRDLLIGLYGKEKVELVDFFV